MLFIEKKWACSWGWMLCSRFRLMSISIMLLDRNLQRQYCYGRTQQVGETLICLHVLLPWLARWASSYLLNDYFDSAVFPKLRRNALLIQAGDRATNTEGRVFSLHILGIYLGLLVWHHPYSEHSGFSTLWRHAQKHTRAEGSLGIQILMHICVQHF